MRTRDTAYYVRAGLIVIGLLVIISGGFFLAADYITPVPPPKITLQPLKTPTPVAASAPTPKSSPTATPTATRLKPTTTPTPAIPPGGIVYALAPDINSVGWVQTNEEGNHFGESYLYTGHRDGVVYHGAIQFDLSFIPKGSTIFMAELDLTGLDDKGLTKDSAFTLNILTAEIDDGWSRHGFDKIHNSAIDEVLPPTLHASDLAQGRANKFIFNAAQRSIIEERLTTSHLISFRLDSPLSAGWFGWDSGYGNKTLGHGPILRLGMLLPVATETAEVPPDSTPTPTSTFVIITSVPTPKNVLTVAALAPTATYEATTTGTPTPLPKNWVTPWVVTSTPTPENKATALFRQAEATSAIIAFGTSTPTPQNMVVATPLPTATPTPIFILLPITPTPTPSVTLEPTPLIPSPLIGKIAFKSDLLGQEDIYVINPDGSGLALLTNRWPYNVAELADSFSADGRFRVFTKNSIRYVDTGRLDPQDKVIFAPLDVPALFWRDADYNIEEQLTHFGAGLAYAGVWSPTNEQIALVSNDSSDDEIWVVNRDGSNLLQLTSSNLEYNAREIGKNTFFPEVNRHPSWSPDGKQIAFWSNRNSGRRQIWVMGADGSNPFKLSKNNANDWDPVWIKYPGVPANAFQNHSMLYNGPYNPAGVDQDCDDFSNQTEAQLFYYAAGGPFRDPHSLDADSNGIACDN